MDTRSTFIVVVVDNWTWGGQKSAAALTNFLPTVIRIYLMLFPMFVGLLSSRYYLATTLRQCGAWSRSYGLWAEILQLLYKRKRDTLYFYFMLIERMTKAPKFRRALATCRVILYFDVILNGCMYYVIHWFFFGKKCHQAAHVAKIVYG